MWDSIVVGFDGGDQGEDAAALALTLARSPEQVTAVCSYQFEPVGARVGKGAIGSAPVKRAAEETLAPLARRGVVRVARAGTAADAIGEVAEEQDADLVVVGSTHRGALGRAMFGTTASTLLRHSARPVAVAPRGYRDRPSGPLRWIGLAFADDETGRHALDFAIGLARGAGGTLTILGVFDNRPQVAGTPATYVWPSPEQREKLQQALDAAVATATAAGVAAQAELLEGGPAQALSDRSDELDVLITGAHARGIIGRALFGSVSAGVIADAHCPVIAVPPGA